jgi:serine/threonine-protein kinase SRK2
VLLKETKRLRSVSISFAFPFPTPKKLPQIGVIGSGTFGVVIKALDVRDAASPVEVAVKMLPRGNLVRAYRTYVKREIVHHSSLRHPLVIRLHEVLLTPHHLCISMEYAKGGDLHSYLQRRPGCKLPEGEARWLFQQLILGLEYCHSRGVANRDLKLENLLLDDAGPRPLLKMCDFGYSKHELNSSAKSGVGTAMYMAPEVILGKTKYDAKKADVWSAGVMMYQLLTGKHVQPRKKTKNISCFCLPIRRTVFLLFLVKSVWAVLVCC